MGKLVISDTSCLIALTNIELLTILRDLYKEVLITSEVFEEFGGNLPDWITVVQVSNKDMQIELEKRLDKGEASSIALALDIKNSILIIDEVKGRKIAKSYNLEIIGTLGLLILANKKGLVNDVISVVLKLVNSGFRLSEKLIEALIEKYGKK